VSGSTEYSSRKGTGMNGPTLRDMGGERVSHPKGMGRGCTKKMTKRNQRKRKEKRGLEVI